MTPLELFAQAAARLAEVVDTYWEAANGDDLGDIAHAEIDQALDRYRDAQSALARADRSLG